MGPIEVKDIEIGDELLYPRNSEFAYIKVLRKPQPSKKPFSWRPTETRWKPVKCSVHMEEKTTTYGVGTNYQYTRTYTEYVPDDQFTQDRFFNFNFRKMWLIKREVL